MAKSRAVNLLLFLLFGYITSTSAQETYPKVAGYVGLIHPLATYTSNSAPVYNFENYYIVGMPTGINLWKTAKVGFSMEFVPFIRSDKTTSRMNNFLFHPGVLARLGKGYTFAGRAAFETSGRYGFTPILNKIVKKNKGSSYYVALPLPVRFGNDHPASFTVAFQFGLVF